MPQTKIQGKFYPLQHEEFLKLNQRLTQSELAVYLWLKTNDPFGDKLVEASTKKIAEDLNVSRRTIQRALVKLRDENLIDLIVTKFQYRVKSNPPEDTSETKVKEKLRVATPGSPSDTNVAIGTRMSPSVRECRHRYENVAIGTGMSPPTAETQSEQELENPKTLKTYTDFIQTLSEDERENFFSYVEEKTKNLKQPINDLEAWLASKNAAKQNRWEIYYKNYQEEKISQKSRNNGKNQGAEALTLAQKKLAIARFKAERNRNRPDLEEDNPENSEEYRQQQAEFNQLLDNPPEYEQEKSLAQRRREAIAKAKEHREEIKQKAARRAKEQTFEERRQEALRMIQREQERQQEQQQNQNPQNNDEINEEDW